MTFEKVEYIKQEIVLPALIYIDDECMETMDSSCYNDTNDEKHKKDCILENIQSINRLGRAAHVHSVLSSQSCSRNVLSVSLVNSIRQKFVCGKTSSSSLLALGIGEHLGRNEKREFDSLNPTETIAAVDENFYVSFKSPCANQSDILKIAEEDMDSLNSELIELSDKLPWYVIPLGRTAIMQPEEESEWHQEIMVKVFRGTPYFWLLHDPRTEGKIFDCLGDGEFYNARPHCFVYGQSGSGKTNLVNNMIIHLVNKANKGEAVELFLTDCKQTSFSQLDVVEGVETISKNTDEVLKVTNYLVSEIHKRNIFMRDEGLQCLPLDGKVDLKNHVNVNGELYYLGESVIYKTSDGKIHKELASKLLEDKDSVIEIKKKF